MTGLIYVAIIALWAAVLIPIWLRRHESDETRAVDRFDGAMRALGRFRRGPRTSAAHAEVSVKGASRVPTAQSSAATRRRNIMIALAVVLVLSVIAWGVGRVPAAIPLIALVLLATFVFIARRQAVAAARASRRSTRRDDSGRVEGSSARTRRGAPARPQRRDVEDDDFDYEGSPPPSRRRREERVYEEIEAEYIEQRTEELARPRRDPLRPTGSWEAQPRTLPTYVDAPAATAVPRGIDRATGTWDSAAMLNSVQEQRARAAQDFFDQTLDYEERRAAGA